MQGNGSTRKRAGCLLLRLLPPCTARRSFRSAAATLAAGSPEGGELRLDGVWFAYPSRPSSWVLRGVDLHVPPGKKVGDKERGGTRKVIMSCVPLPPLLLGPQGR